MLPSPLAIWWYRGQSCLVLVFLLYCFLPKNILILSRGLILSWLAVVSPLVSSVFYCATFNIMMSLLSGLGHQYVPVGLKRILYSPVKELILDSCKLFFSRWVSPLWKTKKRASFIELKKKCFIFRSYFS